MGRRIADTLAELGIGQADLVSRIPGLDIRTVSALIARDSVRSQYSAAIAHGLGVRHLWLTTGDGPKWEGDVRPHTVRARVPLLSWEQVAAMHEARELPSGTESVATIDARPGPNAFAVRITSDSMVGAAGAALSFPLGTVVIVDPARKARNGDFVVALDPVTRAPTFRRLSMDAGRAYLSALNSAFPTQQLGSLEDVVGVACEYQVSGQL